MQCAASRSWLSNESMTHRARTCQLPDPARATLPALDAGRTGVKWPDWFCDHVTPDTGRRSTSKFCQQPNAPFSCSDLRRNAISHERHRSHHWNYKSEQCLTTSLAVCVGQPLHLSPNVNTTHRIQLRYVQSWYTQYARVRIFSLWTSAVSSPLQNTPALSPKSRTKASRRFRTRRGTGRHRRFSSAVSKCSASTSHPFFSTVGHPRSDVSRRPVGGGGWGEGHCIGLNSIS